MSLELARVLQAPGVAAAAEAGDKLVCAAAGGAVRVYARTDAFLERVFDGPRGATAVTPVHGTPLVAVVGQGACQVHNLATRRLALDVRSRSARFAASGDRVLAVASNYKVRVLFFGADGEPRGGAEALFGRQHVRQLVHTAAGFVVVVGAKAQVWLVEAADARTCTARPVLVLPPPLQQGKRFCIAAVSDASDALLVGCAEGYALLHRSATGARIVAQGAQACSAVSTTLTRSTHIPLFVAAFADLELLNPSTGTRLAAVPNSWDARLSGAGLAVAPDGVYEVVADVPLAYIKAHADGSLAFGMQAPADAEIVALQIAHAGELLQTDVHEAMRLFTRVEQQDTAQRVHRRILALLEPVIDAAREDAGDGQVSANNSTFTGLTGGSRHVLDPIAAYLAFTRRKLRLAAAHAQDADASAGADARTGANNDAAATSGPATSSSSSLGDHDEVDKAQISATSSAEALSDLENEKGQPNSSSPAHAASPEPRIADADATDDAALIDTALFRCYLLMRSPLIGPLLRSRNACDTEVVKRALLERGKWKELVWFLRGKRDDASHRFALDLLQKHKQPPESIVQFVEQARPALSTAFEYMQPFLKMRPEYVYRLFFEQQPQDCLLTYGFLKREVSVDMAGQFALHCVTHWDAAEPQLHEEALRYLAHTDAQRCEELALTTRGRPVELMDDTRLPLRARAVLHSRGGDHEGAISLYLDLRDVAAAQLEAVRANLVPYLLDHVVQSQDLLHAFLQADAAHVPAAELLARLPDDMTFAGVAEFLTRGVAADARHSAWAEQRATAARAALAELSIQLSALKRRRFDVDVQDTCYICHKRLGKAVLGVTDCGVAHYACMR